ncbi:CBS domain-containing protein [Streptococcaceae bacterium ESL0687]|nr:CBS domain-containing protein [Streptococcaceae bacterium ESL0687]
MAVKDFMTKEVISVSPDTKVAKVADLMREKNIHRLPVLDNGKLVGLVTEGTIAEATPSKATSLSVYEMNYLLNKTTVKSIMIKNVVTVSQFASLEDAVYLMRENNIGVLPVVDGGKIEGIITDKDVFDAFLQVAGYGEAGVRIRLAIKNEIGALEKITDLVAENEYNVMSILQLNNKEEGTTILEILLEGSLKEDEVQSKFEAAGFKVESVEKTEAKAN